MSFSCRLNLEVLHPRGLVVLPRDLGGEQTLPVERDMCGPLVAGLAVNIKVEAVTFDVFVLESLVGNPVLLSLCVYLK